LRICINIFKTEHILEVWAKNKNDSQYKKLLVFDVCAMSGTLGPKRKEGDMQMPEGFYEINHFNPLSNFYLSLGVNYPNASDRLLSNKISPGGSIYIHGNCVTIGCFPITDDCIKELYVLSVEAKNCGQNKIAISVYPFKMNDENWKIMSEKYKEQSQLISFWDNIRKGYLYFETNKNLPIVTVDKFGKYEFK
jgi:murein L,D-transpeptidase YafK